MEAGYRSSAYSLTAVAKEAEYAQSGLGLFFYWGYAQIIFEILIYVEV
jgi:hypothetical protein